VQPPEARVAPTAAPAHRRVLPHRLRSWGRCRRRARELDDPPQSL